MAVMTIIKKVKEIHFKEIALVKEKGERDD
jgi:hypothetical protein